MRRIFLLIPLGFMCGCSQDREDRREAVKSILLSPLIVASWYLNHQEQSDPKDDIQNIIDRQNDAQLPAGAPTRHLLGNHPDVD
jgi:hypothetical protein